MFRENTEHLQGSLISTLNELPGGMREMLEQSWAGTFRQEVFMRLDEKPLAALYSDKASRPNVPVNVLLGLEMLKAGFGWSDEELYQEFTFNLQVRYALGYEQVGEGHFSIRTLYEFRRRLRDHMQTTGEHLLEQVFIRITDQQMKALSVKSDKLRMDSTQVASHIYQYSRLELLVEILHRVQRMLNEADRDRYGELLCPYLKNDAHHYVYRLDRREADTRLAAIGSVMAVLADELAANYAHEPSYALLVRVFQEHFVLTEGEPQLKPYKDVGVASLQAPDDPEATFHRKRGETYRGYAAHITETCHPDNDLQLIVSIHTQPNAVDDAQALIATLPELLQRTDVNELYTDGGYNSPELDPVLENTSIRHIQTALRGDRPRADGLSLMDFDIQADGAGMPLRLTCPAGQVITVEAGQAEMRFIARPDPAICSACPLLSRCPARLKPTGKTPALYFDRRQLLVAWKRQAIAARSPSQGNLRAAIEATIRSVKNPFRHGKALVRGKFRISSLLLGSALMVNLRRIHRHLTQKPPQSPSSAHCLQRLRSQFTVRLNALPRSFHRYSSVAFGTASDRNSQNADYSITFPVPCFTIVFSQ